MPNHHSRNSFLAKKALQVLAAAEERGAILRILGGLGIYFQCAEFQGLLDRYREPFSDIDLICRATDVRQVEATCAALGYEQNNNWKMHFGYQRRIFYTPEELTIEVYIDKLYLCQEIDLRHRLPSDRPSLSPTDLFLSRIQRVQLTAKDLFDLSILLTSKNLGAAGPDTIDLGYVATLAAASWPWWKTLHDNLAHLRTTRLPALDSEPLQTRLFQLSDAIEREPKSLLWKLRAMIGPRLSWYAEVE
jgi:hypothetical protein